MKKVAFAFIGLLPVIFPAMAQTDDLSLHPEITDAVHERVENVKGAVGLELVTEFVARVVFEPVRPDYKACPDHYPAYFVKSEAPCPSLRDADPPGPGWMNCHGAFYTHEKFGCPPKPKIPVAPATTPRPRCAFGPEACKQEAPGGPVLFRALRVQPTVELESMPGVLTPAARLPRASRPELPISPPAEREPASERPRMPRAPQHPAEACKEAVQGKIAWNYSGNKRWAPVNIARLCRGAEASVEPARCFERVMHGGVNWGGGTHWEWENAINLCEGPRNANATVSCFEEQIANGVPWSEAIDACDGAPVTVGDKDTPITLPPPPVTPVRHVPCEYRYVSFFVPENRYCPEEELGEPPAPGASLYVAWKADDPSSVELFYHRADFDGVFQIVARIIYGSSDDRFAIGHATEREKAAAEATAMLIKDEYVTQVDASTVTLEDDPAWPPLCSTERFYGLPQPGRCSGVKIGDRLVATSAHCVRNRRQCAETSVVFGYFGESATSASRTISRENVYHCTSIVASRRPASFGERGADWTIFEVDRDIEAPSTTLASSSTVHPSGVTTVIGHPMGLPSVVTRLGVVQVTTSDYFIVNSDTFVGNSGSAVFAAPSVAEGAPRVLGLITGGSYDFENSVENGEKCVRARWCNDPGCLGEDVVYADDLIKALSKYAPEP